jgi:hypothetical protein
METMFFFEHSFGRTWRWADQNVSNFDIVGTLGHHKKKLLLEDLIRWAYNKLGHHWFVGQF